MIRTKSPQRSMKPAGGNENHIIMDNGMFVRRYPKTSIGKAEVKARKRRGAEYDKKVNPRRKSPVTA